MKIRLRLDLDPNSPQHGSLQVILINDEGFEEDSDFISLSELKDALDQVNQP